MNQTESKGRAQHIPHPIIPHPAPVPSLRSSDADSKRRTTAMRWNKLAAALALVLPALAAAGARAAETGSVVPIKAIATLEGEEPRPLLGRGIVVGLRGTGDKGKEAQREIAEICRRLGVTISATDLNARKVAIVMLSAEIEPYTRAGESFNVKVSTIEAESPPGSGAVFRIGLPLGPPDPAG